MPVRRIFSACPAVLALSLAYAHAQPAIDHAWSRAPPAMAQAGVVYLTITSPTSDQLIGAASPIAQSVEVHQSRMQDGVMQMRATLELDIPAGKPVRLAPGGYHAMLIGLVKPLQAGDHFPLTLMFRQAGVVTTEVTVERVGTSAPALPPGKEIDGDDR